MLGGYGEKGTPFGWYVVCAWCGCCLRVLLGSCSHGWIVMALLRDSEAKGHLDEACTVLTPASFTKLSSLTDYSGRKSGDADLGQAKNGSKVGGLSCLAALEKVQLGKKSWAVNSGNERISGKQTESRGGRTVLAKRKGFPTSEVEVEDHPRVRQ